MRVRESRHKLQVETLRLKHKGQRLTTTQNAVATTLFLMFMLSADVAIGQFGTT